MKSDEDIRTEEVLSCFICNVPGTPLYTGLRDRHYGAPGVWGFLRCPNCHLVWLNPRPLPAEIRKVYANYYTHSPETRRVELTSWKEKTKRALYASTPGYGALADHWGWRLFGRALSMLSSFREIAKMGIMCMDDARKGKVLEIGCGMGEFLFLMRKAGWEVLGVEPDPVAAKSAEELFKVPVLAGTLADARLPDNSFDAVAISHVIEHVHDPVALLRECWRVLKPGGRIVGLTPNLESRGHQIFREAWRELDPPRHLYLFSLETLRKVADRSGIAVRVLRTSSRNARGIWADSSTIKSQGNLQASKPLWRSRLRGWAFQWEEERSRRSAESAGEELLLIAGRES